jgi:hypothetical protein
MSTRSYVAAETEQGIKGVYVHWDGYPSERIPHLQAFAQRDGLAKMVETIIGKPNGWSTLDCHQKGQLPEWENDGRFVAIPRYGVQYTDTPVKMGFQDEPVIQADPEYWTPETHDPRTWCEYVYIIRTNGTVDWAQINGPIDQWQWHTEVLGSR